MCVSIKMCDDVCTCVRVCVSIDEAMSHLNAKLIRPDEAAKFDALSLGPLWDEGTRRWVRHTTDTTGYIAPALWSLGVATQAWCRNWVFWIDATEFGCLR